MRNDTTQLGIRINNGMIKDLEMIEKILNIKKEDFIRAELAKVIYDIKMQLHKDMVIQFEVKEK